jgi:hypothetical protein
MSTVASGGSDDLRRRALVSSTSVSEDRRRTDCTCILIVARNRSTMTVRWRGAHERARNRMSRIRRDSSSSSAAAPLTSGSTMTTRVTRLSALRSSLKDGSMLMPRVLKADIVHVTMVASTRVEREPPPPPLRSSR